MSEQETTNTPAPEAAETRVAAPEGAKAASDVKGLLAQLEAFLDDCMIKKAPFQIPANGKEILAKIAPYLVILGGVLAVPAVAGPQAEALRRVRLRLLSHEGTRGGGGRPIFCLR